MPYVTFHNKPILLRWTLSTSPNLKAGGPPLVGCPRLQNVRKVHSNSDCDNGETSISLQNAMLVEIFVPTKMSGNTVSGIFPKCISVSEQAVQQCTQRQWISVKLSLCLRIKQRKTYGDWRYGSTHFWPRHFCGGKLRSLTLLLFWSRWNGPRYQLKLLQMASQCDRLLWKAVKYWKLTRGSTGNELQEKVSWQWYNKVQVIALFTLKYTDRPS